MNKQDIITALRKHIAGRSGIDFRNYGDRASAMEDYRKILRHGKQARAMLRAIELRESITADMLESAFQRAYSGRLSYSVDKGCDYCAGQYYATEYRAAACAVLACALRNYWLDDGRKMDEVRKLARAELGRAIANVWFG